MNYSLPTLTLYLVQALSNSNVLLGEAAQINATVQKIRSESQEINTQISITNTLHGKGSVLTNQSSQYVYTAMHQWNTVKVQLQLVYNQSSNLLHRINSTKTLIDVVQREAYSTASLYQSLNVTRGMQQNRRLQLEAEIKAVQSSVQYLRQLRNAITTKCFN